MDRSARSPSSELAVVAACAGVAFLALVAGIDGSPLQPLLPQGSTPLLPFRAVSRATGLATLGHSARDWVSAVAVVAAAVTFLYALREAWRGTLSVRLVVGLGIAFVAVAVALPLLFSRDVYSYAIYGRIASVHHANPYVSTPMDFSADPLFSLVGPKWRDTTAVYGPGFTLLSSGLTSVVKGTDALIVAYKVIAGLAAVGTILLVARAARRLWPDRAAFATALVAWNPVVLFHTIGGGHNDMLVALSVAGALAILAGGRSPRRELVATAVLALGATVKATAAIPLVLVIVAAVWRRAPGRRVRTGAGHVAVAGGIGVALAAPFFQTHDPTFGLATLATHEGWLAPTRFFRRVLGALGDAIAGHAGETAMHGLVRVAFAVVFVVAFLAIARSVARRAGSLDAKGEGAAWGWALLVGTLVAPVVLPWYMAWTLPVVWLLPRRGRAVALVLSSLLTVSLLAAEVNRPSVLPARGFVRHYVLAPSLFVALVALLMDLRRRIRTGSLLDEDLAAAGEEGQEVAAARHRG